MAEKMRPSVTVRAWQDHMIENSTAWRDVRDSLLRVEILDDGRFGFTVGGDDVGSRMFRLDPPEMQAVIDLVERERAGREDTQR